MNYEQELLIKLYDYIGKTLNIYNGTEFDFSQACEQCGLNSTSSEIGELRDYVYKIKNEPKTNK